MTRVKSFLRTFLVTGVLVGIPIGLYQGLVVGNSNAVWYGIAGGFVVGLVAAALTRVRQNRVLKTPPVLTEEVILHRARADHQGMAGLLYLTDRRLLFEGYPTDVTEPEITALFETHLGEAAGHDFSIPILQISEIMKSKPLGLGSRLDVVVTNGETKSFGTENLDEWVDEISAARQKFLDEPRTEELKLFP